MICILPLTISKFKLQHNKRKERRCPLCSFQIVTPDDLSSGSLWPPFSFSLKTFFLFPALSLMGRIIFPGCLNSSATLWLETRSGQTSLWLIQIQMVYVSDSAYMLYAQMDLKAVLKPGSPERSAPIRHHDCHLVRFPSSPRRNEFANKTCRCVGV